MFGLGRRCRLQRLEEEQVRLLLHEHDLLEVGCHDLVLVLVQLQVPVTSTQYYPHTIVRIRVSRDENSV